MDENPYESPREESKRAQRRANWKTIVAIVALVGLSLAIAFLTVCAVLI